MNNIDHDDDDAVGRLDDGALEVTRLRMLRDGDERLELVLRHLVIRGLPMIGRVCADRAQALGLSDAQRQAAIEDAGVRLLLRLGLEERLPRVGAIAAHLAAECTDAQLSKPQGAPRLAVPQPQLRIVEQLGDALREGRIRRNDGRTS